MQKESNPKFEGSQQYIATADLKMAVNAALTVKRPLLIKGEPGTGKTMLAEEVANALGGKKYTRKNKRTRKSKSKTRKNHKRNFKTNSQECWG